VTERAIEDLIGEAWGKGWERAWGAFRRVPASTRRGLLRVGSPQWFFFLERPRRPGDEREPGS
jgi:hypothetical protein